MRPQEAPLLPASVRRLAVAVECFHKASLVHDDIEDGDAFRYGRRTLHERWGVPVALNAGDFLLGEGYRLIGLCDLAAEARSQLLQAAARAHRELCLGQGDELAWLREFHAAGRPLTVPEVVEIFRRKTAPAFGGALRFGAIAAGADEALLGILDQYSEHLGVAYQVQDDLADLAEGPQAESETSPGSAPAQDTPASPRPSILMALAYEAADGPTRQRLLDLWRSGAGGADEAAELARLVTALGAERAARDILRQHLDEAMAALAGVRAPGLKRLLRQVLGSIFPHVLLCDPGVFARVPAGVPAGIAAPAK